MSHTRTVRTDPRGPAGRQAGLTLVELLVAMTISLVISAMILVSWFALSGSYANTVKRGKAGDWARFALARMEREIRDVEQPPAEVTATEVGIVRARPYYIVLYTTFNKPNNTLGSERPRLVMYRLYQNGELWRFHDANGDGTLSGVALTVDAWPQPAFNLGERSSGEGAQLVAVNLVNAQIPSTEPTAEDEESPYSDSSATPLFTYLAYGQNGALQRWKAVLGVNDRINIKAVEINLLVDLNPGKSPIYSHLRTTAQLRNAR